MTSSFDRISRVYQGGVGRGAAQLVQVDHCMEELPRQQPCGQQFVASNITNSLLELLRTEWFELKMKFDESDNLLVRATRSITDKVVTNVGSFAPRFHWVDVRIYRCLRIQAACLRRVTWQ